MREYENKYINSEKTAWDLRSILSDLAGSWWMILLVALSASLLTYSVISFTHEDRYTVSTTFTVSQGGGESNAVTNLSAAYEMAQKFSVILDNNILKKTVMEELGLDSFPATMNASIVQESNLMQLSVTADSPQHAYLILESVLRNYPTLSDYIIPNVVLQTLEQPQISGSPSNQLPVRQYMIYAFLAAAAVVAALIAVFSHLRDTVKNEQEFNQKVDAYLPQEYVQSDALRVEMYKKIASIRDRAGREDLIEELVDRFGDPNRPVMNLIETAHLKALCSQLGIDHVSMKGGEMVLRFSIAAQLNAMKLLAAVKPHEGKLRLVGTNPPSLRLFDAKRRTAEELLPEAVRVMEDILARMDGKEEGA